jgi:RNA polymerase sigma-70 factor (ECF subfamily)
VTTSAIDQDHLPDPMSWVESHGDVLFRFAMVRVRDRAVAEDLVQETLLAAIQSLGSLAQVSSERSWLVGILRHKVLDYFRQRARDQRLWDDSVEPTDAESAFDGRGGWKAAPGEWESPERSLERDEFFATFGLCIDALPPNLRTTFALREFDGIGSEDLAETLGTTKNNLWVMLSRARQRLRDCLERHWFNA